MIHADGDGNAVGILMSEAVVNCHVRLATSLC